MSTPNGVPMLEHTNADQLPARQPRGERWTEIILAAMLGISLGLLFARDTAAYTDRVFSLMANRTAAVAVVCWLWAGAFSGVLGDSGLVEAIQRDVARRFAFAPVVPWAQEAPFIFYGIVLFPLMLLAVASGYGRSKG